MHSKILILDFGSQVTQLIARRVRDAGVFSEVYPYDLDDEFIRNYGASGIIVRLPQLHAGRRFAARTAGRV